MKLKTYMDKLQSKSELIYISTGQCWVFCGTKPEYERYIEDINYELKKGLIAAVDNRQNKIDAFNDPDKKGKGRWMKYSQADRERILKGYEHSLELAQKDLDAFVDIWDRDILEVRKKDHLYPGTAIVVKGNTRVKGPFWTRDEFEQWINKKEGKVIYEPVEMKLYQGLDPYINLGCAVVRSAVNDYRSIRAWLCEHPAGTTRVLSKEALERRKQYLGELKSLEDFFEGDQIKLLTNIDGRRILEHLRTESIEIRQEGNSIDTV